MPLFEMEIIKWGNLICVLSFSLHSPCEIGKNSSSGFTTFSIKLLQGIADSLKRKELINYGATCLDLKEVEIQGVLYNIFFHVWYTGPMLVWKKKLTASQVDCTLFLAMENGK